MNEKYLYLTKKIDNNSIKSVDDEDSLYALEFEIDVATSHKDRGYDVVTKEFIEKLVKDYKESTTYLFGHDMNRPIGKILDSVMIQYKDGEYGLRLNVGISKEEKKIANLIRDGTLNKASIGFMPDYKSMKYDEKEDTFYIYNGEGYEASSVSVPMNNKTGHVRITKDIRDNLVKSYKQDSESEFDMDEKELIKLITTVVNESVEKAISSTVPATEEVHVTSEEDLQKMKSYEDKIAELEEEKKAFVSRKTDAEGVDEMEDKYFLNDSKKALQFAFDEIAEAVKSGEPFFYKIVGAE